LTLKKDATGNTKGLKKEISNTQHLVENSKKTLSRVVGKLGK
jgi:hypothetical protein